MAGAATRIQLKKLVAKPRAVIVHALRPPAATYLQGLKAARASALWPPTSRLGSRTGGLPMAVARVTEISSTSSKSFEDAIQQGVARATKTLRNVRSAWIKEQRVDIRDGSIAEYQVNLMVTFVLDD